MNAYPTAVQAQTSLHNYTYMEKTSQGLLRNDRCPAVLPGVLVL